MKKKYLFVCGSPRSGTTAMWNFLTSDSRIKMGVERYGNLFFAKTLTRELFEKDRFFELKDGDTFYSDLNKFSPYYEKIESSYENGEYFGDKIPLLYRYLDSLKKSIPDCKVVVMIRNIIDVAASYESRANNINDTTWDRNKRTQSAIEDWRESLKIIKNYSDDDNVIPIIYEDFYSDIDNAISLYKRLGLEFSEKNREYYNQIQARSRELEGFRNRKLNSEAVQNICETAPFGLYREVLKEIRVKND